jgi:cation diffusion facilitator CzcD-associated flavoprotein CzcO
MRRAQMTDLTDELSDFDQQAVRAKYLAERDKRMVEGRAAIRDLTSDAVFAEYLKDPFTPVAHRNPLFDEVDVAIIGAGMAGVVAGAQLRKVGLKRIRLMDKAGGFGGAWYWNRYPGVMCDVESYCYMPMLEEMGYIPKTRYAFGEEIRGYLEAIAQRFDLVDSALLHTGVETSEWDEGSSRWVLRTDRGDEIRARYLVMAVGILNLMKLPAIPGMDKFRGRSFHSARWDYEYTGGGPEGNLTKLSDKVVGIMGTGASAIQCIPSLAGSSKQLFVFQRTPGAVGERGNHPTSEDFAKSLRPGWHRERNENFQAMMLGRPVEVDLVNDGWCHHYARINNQPFKPGMTIEDYMLQVEQFDFEVMELHRRRIRETVTDPAKAQTLMPYYPYSCRRPLFHDEYLPALNQRNVTIVDCPGGIDRVTERGVVIGGREYDLDCIVYATGFEPEITPLPRRVGHEVIGRGGLTLASKWEEGERTLFGMMTSGFPNLFLMPCPGHQAVVTVNYTLLTEISAEHLAATFAELDAEGVSVFDVTEHAEANWVEQILSVNGGRGSAIPPRGVPCTPGSRMVFDDAGNAVVVEPNGGSYGGGFGDYFGFRDLLVQWREQGDFAGLAVERPPTLS